MLSKWHRQQFGLFFPEVPADKFFVTRNGIDLRRFERCRRGFIPKDPHRFVYSSSADRGLENLLDMWSRITRVDPLARLHLYYGLDTWLKIAERRGNPTEFDRIKTIVEACKQPGIVVHGRVGQRQLAEDFAMSNLWLYPSSFMETSCITAMETAAVGVHGILSPIGALPETAPFADFIDGEASTPEYKETFLAQIIERLAQPRVQERSKAMELAWRRNDWRGIAQEWSDLFTDRLERKRVERTKSESAAVTDLSIVVPYSWSGGVQYPLELGNELGRRGLKVKMWMLKLGGEMDLSALLPGEDDAFQIVTIEELQERASEVLDCKNLIVTNWQTHEAVRSIGADAVKDLNRINLVQGDERRWASADCISSMMSDPAWQIIYASKYLADALQVPGRIVPDGIPRDTLSFGNIDDRAADWAGIVSHDSDIKNTDVVIRAAALPAWPASLNLLVLVGTEAEEKRIAAMPEWTSEQGAGIREMRRPKAGEMFERLEVLSTMSNCGVWFVPSLEEGFGLVGLEAMAAGCNLITSAPGGMQTYCNRYNSVGVKDARSAEVWAESVKIFTGLEVGEKQMMRHLGHCTAETYTIDKTAEAFLRDVIQL